LRYALKEGKGRESESPMSWKLVFALSLFGLAMGFATVFVIGPSNEPWCWLGIFTVCAFILAKRAPGKYFLHGLLVSLLNSVWITAVHVALYDKYIANHAREAAMMATAPLAPRTMMLVTGPVIGLVSGIVLGLFAWIMSKFVVSAHSEYRW
jgi:hypothetical protein